MDIINDSLAPYVLGGVGTGLSASIPLCLMPLASDLSLTRGIGAAVFTRSTTGTYLDKDDGLLKIAAIDAARFETDGVLIEAASTNILLRSEELDDAAWGKTNATVSADVAVAPDGNTTADKITEDGTVSVIHRVSQGVTVASSADPYTLSCYAAGTERFLQLGLSISASDYGIVTFDLSGAGSVTDTRAGASGTVNGSAIELVSGGNYRCQMTYTPAGASTSRVAVTGLSDLGTGFTEASRGSASYSGDSSSGLNAWGAQLEALTFASSYIPTVASTVARTLDDLDILATNIPAPTADYSVFMAAEVVGLDSSKTQTLFSVDGETSRKIEVNTTTGIVEATHGAVTSSSTTAITPGTAMDICFVVDGTNQTLYINGSQEDQDAKGTVTGTATAVSIGNAAGISQELGHIKDFRTYNVALTAAQVGEL